MLHWHHRTGDSTHTGGGGGESRGVSGEGEREGGSFISSSHHPLPLLLLSVISLVLCQKTNYMKKAKSLSWMQLGSRGEKQSGAEKRTRTSSLHHLHREEWDASFFSWERDYKVHCGAPPYIPPIPPSVPCLSTAHVTSPRCHSDGATCCRQEGEEERRKGGGKKNIRGKKIGKQENEDGREERREETKWFIPRVPRLTLSFLNLSSSGQRREKCHVRTTKSKICCYHRYRINTDLNLLINKLLKFN